MNSRREFIMLIGGLALDEIVHQGRQSIELILCPTIFDHDIVAIDEAGFAQTLPKCRGQMSAGLR